MEALSQNHPDSTKLNRHFLVILAILSLVGVIMVYSSSYIYAKENYGTSVYYFMKQILFMVTGIGIGWVTSRTKLSFWLKYGKYFNIICTSLLVLTFIPGIGVSAKGASRWISIFGLKFQPAELVKYSLIVSALPYCEKFFQLELKERVKWGASLMAPLALLVLQPDFGAFSICFLVLSFVCFMSSFPRKYFYSIFSVGAILGAIILVAQPYRVKRLMTFLDPWQNPRGSGFQIIQSFLAFANGSIFGQGVGNSNEKLFYLPEAHNDFIFSVVGEELGFVGVTVLVGLFLVLIYLGLKIALETGHRLAMLLVSSVIFTMGIQAVLNMAVVLGLLPTKGLNLPFISYGGSSIVANFFAIGLMFSAVRHCQKFADTINQNPGYKHTPGYGIYKKSP